MDHIIPIRLDARLVDGIDALVKDGLFRNRNEGIRQGIGALLGSHEKPLHAVRFFASKVIANIIVETFDDLVQCIVLFGSVARGEDTR